MSGQVKVARGNFTISSPHCASSHLRGAENAEGLGVLGRQNSNEMEGKELAVRARGWRVSGKTGLGTGWRGRMRRTRPSGAVVSLSVVGYASRRDDFVPSSSGASRF